MSPQNPQSASHNTTIKWKADECTAWSSHCFTIGLSLPCHSSLVDHLEAPQNIQIPELYLDLSNEFSKDKAAKIPPRCPGIVSLIFFSGSSTPRSMSTLHIWNKSHGRHQRRSKPRLYLAIYIPCSGRVILFGEQLWCTMTLIVLSLQYYHGQVWIPTASCPFHRWTGKRNNFFFVKLDLWNAYNLICIKEGDEWEKALVITISCNAKWVH